MGSTSDLRVGAVIDYNGEPCVIVQTAHRFMGRGSGFHQVKMRNVKTGRVFENKFRSNENIDYIRIERREFQFLYQDGPTLYVMNTDTYEQIPVDAELLGDAIRFLKESAAVEISFNGDEVLDVSLPTSVYLEVTQTEPGVRGDTVTNVTKPATLETGAEIQVPIFINEGDVLKVNTETGEYQERQKK